MTQVNELSDELGYLARYLNECAARLHRGEAVDLTGFEAKIAEVCEKITALPEEDARGLMPRVQQMIFTLNQVEQDLMK